MTSDGNSYTGNHNDINSALWPEKWSGTEEGYMIYLKSTPLRARTIAMESETDPNAKYEKVITFKFEGSKISRIIRLSNMLYFAKQCGADILQRVDENTAYLREDLIVRLSYNSMVFLNK